MEPSLQTWSRFSLQLMPGLLLEEGGRTVGSKVVTAPREHCGILRLPAFCEPSFRRHGIWTPHLSDRDIFLEIPQVLLICYVLIRNKGSKTLIVLRTAE